MTGRTITAAQVTQLVPTLFAHHHAIALTPATDDLRWAAEMSWAMGRAAASAGRRVLLVDTGLPGGELDGGATSLGSLGIAEAFEGNLPLADVTTEQDIPGLHYIRQGAGAGPGTWASERWQRLARGFANEDALLLLCAPPAALQAFPIENLALVVLAPAGYTAAGGAFPRIAERLDAGVPLVAVVARRLTPPPPRPRSSGAGRRARSRRGPAYAGAAALVLGLGGAVLLWARGSDGKSPHEAARPERASLQIPGARPAESPDDSLYYSVQVAAHDALSQAMAHAASIEQTGRLVVVTPVRVGTQGIWYRVLVGALPTARAADSLLQELWREGALERPQGTILRTPDTYRLRASRDDVPGLRARGVPAYIVLAPDNTDQVYVGAFDLAEQARTTDSLLASADLAGTLVRRTGSSQ